MCSLPEAAVSRRPRILLRVAAGPRLGFGHLVRARTLTRALDADVRISVRGTARVISIDSAESSNATSTICPAPVRLRASRAPSVPITAYSPVE